MKLKLLQIKDLSKSQLESLLTLQRECFPNAIFLFDNWKLYFHDRWCAFYEENHQVLSAILCEIKVSNSAFLHNIGTLVHYRKKGYVSSLLSYLLSSLKESRIREVTLTVHPLNENSLRLYLKHGFIQEKSEKEHHLLSLKQLLTPTTK